MTLRVQSTGKEKIALLGGLPTQEDMKQGFPFSSKSGQELYKMCQEAGLDPLKTRRLTAFPSPPPKGEITSWCGPKKSVKGTLTESLPPVTKGKYLQPSHWGTEESNILTDLKKSLKGINICICLGPEALWAVSGESSLKSLRGTVFESPWIPGLKCLATYDPRDVFKVWQWRTVGILDLIKAQRESEFPEIRRPHRTITINPTLEDLNSWLPRFRSASHLAVDIETSHNQITECGIAISPSEALVVPFVDQRRPGYSYWETPEDELRAWLFLKAVLMNDSIKIFQNGLFDLQYLWLAGIPVHNALEDTMVMQHALQPELPKSLGFLGSIYTDEAAWKLMRDEKGLKADD